MEEFQTIKLHGRVILEGEIEALTGLHIGGSPGALAIGGVDLPVIRNPVDQRPYIPGSSLKGKMRSLWEKVQGVKQNRSIGKGVSIHACEAKTDYEKCPVCQIYGTLGQSDAAFPTRIVVRDVPLNADSLKEAKTDLPFSEVKWEAAIDRVTSAATPRQIERVPAGARFHEMQIVFNIYNEADRGRFFDVLAALQLVEDDYLGGHGSRGSGRVAFKNLRIRSKRADNYRDPNPPTREFADLHAVLADSDLANWLNNKLPINGGN